MKKIFLLISVVVLFTSKLFGQPHFAIAPPSLDFGPVNVGLNSTLQSVVSNDGTAPLEFSNITSSEGQFTFAPNTFPISVPVGGNQVFDVTFSPTSLGSFTATLSFFHNGVNVGSPYNYSVEGIGVDEGPMFVVTPTSLHFGTVYVGNTSTKHLTVTNYSFTNTLNITSVSTKYSDYSVTPTTATIPPGGNQVFDVTFSPTSIGSFSENVIFTHNGPTSPNFVPVYGVGINAATVDIPFSVSSGIDTLFNVLRVGLDITATDSIDPQLGEFEYIPYPPPPTGGVEALFYLHPYNIYTFRDYRNASFFPFTGTRVHTLAWDLGSGTSFTIFYNFPSGVSANIEDTLGGIFFSENLSGSGSFTVPNNSIRWAILTMYYNNVIPVELNSFTASVVQYEKAVQLNWDTATETNNSGFEIERASLSATPGQGWEKIGFVPGFGTTTEPKSYSYIDRDITTGTYKYRLKQIDFDGSFEYSNEIEVEVDFTPKEFVLNQNYPNPFNPSTVISYQLPVTSNVSLKIYDVLGNKVATLVNEEKQSGVYEVEFDASSFASGMYLYKLQAGVFIQTKKMILLR